jgi:hypothetical protein
MPLTVKLIFLLFLLLFDHARLGAKRLGQSLHLVGNDTIGRLGGNPFRHDGL